MKYSETFAQNTSGTSNVAFDSQSALSMSPGNLTTVNSTPEKPEQDLTLKGDTLEIADLKIEGQKSNLMPKRIMSSKAKKAEEPVKIPVKKVPKDRSALVGMKRTRKSRDQIY